MHICCRPRSIDTVQRVNGANKANKAYAECFKIRKCGRYRFGKA